MLSIPDTTVNHGEFEQQSFLCEYNETIIRYCMDSHCPYYLTRVHNHCTVCKTINFAPHKHCHCGKLCSGENFFCDDHHCTNSACTLAHADPFVHCKRSRLCQIDARTQHMCCADCDRIDEHMHCYSCARTERHEHVYSSFTVLMDGQRLLDHDNLSLSDIKNIDSYY